MSYTKQNFVNGNVLTAEQLNEIENGIVQNETDINKLKNPINPELKLLVLGDSLFSRANGKAFINSLGCKVENWSVGGATFSSVFEVLTGLKEDGKTLVFNTISTQLINFRAAVAAEKAAGITEGEGALKFHEPDAILFDGGGNDYMRGAVMGSLKVAPAQYLYPEQPNPSAYDFASVMGSLESLLFNLNINFPDAQKFYVAMHRVFECNTWTLAEGKHRYWPAVKTCLRVYDSVNKRWEILYKKVENHFEPVSTGNEIAEESTLYITRFGVADSDQDGKNDKITKVAEVYDKSSLYNSEGELDIAKFQGWYTFDTLKANIVKGCQLYGVNVVDVYNSSCINAVELGTGTLTQQDGYWCVDGVKTNLSATETVQSTTVKIPNPLYFDWIGLHPTELAYEVGYKPYITEALRSANKK